MAATSLILDDIDTRLLEHLQVDADQTLRELGDQAGLSSSAVQRRIQRYKSSGLLRTVAVIDPQRVPALTQALVVLTLVEESTDHHRDLAQRLLTHSSVQQVYALSGRWDYAILVSAPSVCDLRDLNNELFKNDPNIRRYDTMFILDAVETGTTLPTALLSS
ncbi:Lrp/AsnC family transcriptional regulator [Rhodococcus qingshengii]|uniref:Lrp/AsnC family transcriptional regulator n=1 Tax=Rhodococcus qingshengii TaxID=334542 RepID=UPI001BEA4B64|nr:Lrp/AsnC family transcriptional regulator [Rhodococcus qingshengii]MBT2273600.1 Lrp/AsnC family transcriptional regulator [Rhodococcus qingshengii]